MLYILCTVLNNNNLINIINLQNRILLWLMVKILGKQKRPRRPPIFATGIIGWLIEKILQIVIVA